LVLRKFLNPSGPLPAEPRYATEPINGREPEQSEDDIKREQLGPRGVPSKTSPAKMTPRPEKKTPKNVDPGHRA